MSIMAESNVYESMVDDGLNEKLCLAGGSSEAFMFIPKIEHDVDDTMLSPDEMDGGKTEIYYDGVARDTYDCIGQPHVYYEEVLSACEEVEVDYKPSTASTMPSTVKLEEQQQRQWDKRNHFNSPPMQDVSFEDDQSSPSYPEESENFEDSDEETIATFLTAAGQRLALYAVEDSDEVFAVAVYDESGEPPTNFQFLMKSDVERLIGEGAVRTVKKPRLMKKQLFSAETPSFTHQTDEPGADEVQLKTEIVEPDESHNTCQTSCINDDDNLTINNNDHETKRKSSPSPVAREQPDFTYLLMEDTPHNVDAADRVEEIITKEPAELTTPLPDFDDAIPRTTVQNILFGDDDSDGELTLADVEETLRNHKPIVNNVKQTKETKGTETLPKETPKEIEKNDDKIENAIVTTNIRTPDELPDNLVNLNVSSTPINADKTSPTVNSPTKSPKFAITSKKMTSSLIRKRDNFSNERSHLPSITSLVHANSDENFTPQQSAKIPEILQLRTQAKRSRKQQLTSVNRDDTEIIIQPANFTSDDDDETAKKRGKRRRGRPSTASKAKIATMKKIATRLSTRPRRSTTTTTTTTVEIIEIDVDDDDRLLASNNNVVEIIIDENKEKNSSDKENEVIMVGDSDDETIEAEASLKRSTTTFKCRDCSKNFRLKRRYDTHRRLCKKSLNTTVNDVRKTRRSSTRSTDSTIIPKKQYPCKICQAKFDVVVALATHVRSMHATRKKLKSRIRRNEEVAETTKVRVEIDSAGKKRRHSESVGTTVMQKRKKKTKIKTANRSWKSNELHCEDCGRWFSSDALLTAHSLQHATKKSEKQTRRCQTCKKLFKSRLSYIRHMRMHSRAKQLQKKLQHQPRQTVGKSTTLRKRGRPRKL